MRPGDAARIGCAAAVVLLGACGSQDGPELTTADITASSSTAVVDRALSEPASSEATPSGSSSSTVAGATTASTEDSDSTPSTAAPATSLDSTTTTAPAGASSTTPTSGSPDVSTVTTSPATTSVGSTTTSSPATTSPATTSTTTTTATSTTTSAPAPRPDRLELPAGVGAIEGVATDRTTGRVFVGDLNTGDVWVGNTSAEPFERFSAAGAVGRSNALGLATDEARRRLYVVSMSQGRVDAINLDTGAHVRSIAMPGAASLNDVAVAPDGTLYVTDLGRPVVYRVAAGASTGEVWVDYTNTGAVDTGAVSQHGNGIVADNQVVLVAYMVGGELLRFDRSTGAVSGVAIAGASTAGRDGLALCGNRLHGVDPAWLTGGADRVWVTTLSGDRASGTSAGSITSPDFSGISTVAPLDGSLVVANAQFGVSPKAQPFSLALVDANC